MKETDIGQRLRERLDELRETARAAEIEPRAVQSRLATIASTVYDATCVINQLKARAEKAESRVKDLEGEVARRLNDNIQHRERERALGDRVAKLEGELATTTSTLRDVFRVCLQLGKDYYDGLVND